MVEEIRRGLSDRLDLNEKLLMRTQEELQKTKEELKMAREELKQTQEELLIKDVETKEYRTATRQELYNIRAPPHMHACGANHDLLSSSGKVIPYTNILYNATNTEGGGLNTGAGTFTSSWPGSYSVTWSLTTYGSNAMGKTVWIYLRHNGQPVDDGRHYSNGYSGDDGTMWDQGKQALTILIIMLSLVAVVVGPEENYLISQTI